MKMINESLSKQSRNSSGRKVEEILDHFTVLDNFTKVSEESQSFQV